MLKKILLRIERELKRSLYYLWSFLVNVVFASVLFPKRWRWRAYRILGIKNNHANINPRCFFRSPGNIEIGYQTFINNNCFIENNALVTIGNRCAIAMDVIIGTDTHEEGEPNRRAGKAVSFPIEIGDGCWIGARATILSGVTIGEGCVIAAGSVVTKDCKPHGLYAGVPATRKKDLPNESTQL